MERATIWLRDYLIRRGRAEVRALLAAARQAGFTRTEIRAARIVLDVQHSNNGGRGRKPTEWYWFLPPKGVQT